MTPSAASTHASGAEWFSIVALADAEELQPPEDPLGSWLRREGRSWNFWRGRSRFVLPALFCAPRPGRRWVVPFAVGFNSHKNVSSFAAATAALRGDGRNGPASYFRIATWLEVATARPT